MGDGVEGDEERSERIEIPVPAVVVLVGPSGAGKSTWAAANFDPDEIVSSDRLRAVVGHAEDDLEATDDAFALLDAIVEARSRRRLLSVVDTLGLDPAKRLGYRSVAAEHGLPCVAVTFPVDVESCRTRNRLRPHPVPAPALKQQLSRWSAANDEVATEGFDAVVEAATVRHVDALGPASSRRVATTTTSGTTAAGQPASGAAVGGIDVGLHISAFPWDDVATGLHATATTAEGAGVRSLWVMDHVRQIPQVGRDWDPMLEAYAALSWMAGVTERVRLGALVTPVTFRNVGLLAKAIATLDVLSAGRAVCGIGLGWYEREHRAYGLDFPSTADRYQLLEDALGGAPDAVGPGGQAVRRARWSTCPRPSGTPDRSRRASRSCSAVAASGGRCASPPGTPTPSTSWGRSTSCGARSRSSTSTAPPWTATPPRSG